MLETCSKNQKILRKNLILILSSKSKDILYEKIIDLTMNINEKMHVYKVHWHPKVKIKQLGSFKNVNRETRQITLGTHTGTHVDAPRHFINRGKTIESIP